MKYYHWMLIAMVVLQMALIIFTHLFNLNNSSPNQEIELIKHKMGKSEKAREEVGSESKTKELNWWRYKNEWAKEVLVKYIGNKKLEFSKDYIKRMDDKGDNRILTVYSKFENRRRRVEEFCKSYPIENNHLSVQVPSSHLYNQYYEIISCLPPQTTSSQWLTIFSELADVKELAQIPVVHNNLSVAFHLRNEEFIARTYQTYLKFYTVRHPFERLLSVFYGKLKHKESEHLRTYGPEIIKYNYLQGYPTKETQLIKKLLEEKLKEAEVNQKISQLRRMKGRTEDFNLTFLEFVRYIIKVKDRNKLDPNWRPMALLCNPCILQYDVIMKFETMYDDANKFLEFLITTKQKGIDIDFPKKRIMITRKRCNTEFSDIPAWLKSELYKIYEEDFVFYNYNTSLKDPCMRN